MELPCVVVAAGAYEGELCRRVFADIGLRVVVTEEDGTLPELVGRERPILVVIATTGAAESVSAVIAALHEQVARLPVFVVVDRDGHALAGTIAGASRVFLRPLDLEELAHAVEKVAVAAEAAEAAPPGQPTGTASGEAPPQPSPPAPAPGRIPTAVLRADEALSDAAGLGLGSLGADERTGQGTAPREPVSSGRFHRELSSAEQRLFPGTAPSLPSVVDDFDDALGDIDLEAIGVGPRADAELGGPGGTESRARAATQVEVDASHRDTQELPRAAGTRGSLAEMDVATLLGRITASGFSGRLRLSRGGIEKIVFFEEGSPVGASSTLAHDQVPDMLLRAGKLPRELYARAREGSPTGRRAVQRLVDLGAIRPSEQFALLRRQTEEIYFSLFGWERGEFELDATEIASQDRVRLDLAPRALIVEGVRRKYSLERLTELLGGGAAVLVPGEDTRGLLAELGLGEEELELARLFDGRRTVDDVGRAATGAESASFGEAGLMSLGWGLCAVGALGLNTSPQIVPERIWAEPTAGIDRRQAPRPPEADADERVSLERARIVTKHGQVLEADYFEVLGVARDASAHEVKRAFDVQRGDFSPERFLPAVREELRGELSDISKVLGDAVVVLSDPSIRRAYASGLTAGVA